MASLKKRNPALSYGLYQPMEVTSDKIFAYYRVEGKEKFAIVLNFSDENTTFPFPLKGTKVIGNYGDEASELRSWEAVIYKLDT